MEPDRFGNLFRYQEFGPEEEFYNIRELYKNFGEGTECHVYLINKHQEKYVVTDHQLSSMMLKAVVAMYELKAEGSFDDTGSMREIDTLIKAYEAREYWTKLHGNDPDWEGFLDHMQSYVWNVWCETTDWIEAEYQLYQRE